MRQRCLNPDAEHLAYYGGRGISICREWDEFTVFYHWAKANGWAPGLTIDRIDVDGNYEPGNCRWATPQQQTINRRPQLGVQIGSRTLNVRQWSLVTGIAVTTLYKRFHAGIRGDAFIALPVNPAVAKPLDR